ncbi:MAG: S8 family serine peptidase [Chloroflexi bacterium]|nr:S8 family serine peptidase [Chloroflexota bacterium]
MPQPGRGGRRRRDGLRRNDGRHVGLGRREAVADLDRRQDVAGAGHQRAVRLLGNHLPAADGQGRAHPRQPLARGIRRQIRDHRALAIRLPNHQIRHRVLLMCRRDDRIVSGAACCESQGVTDKDSRFLRSGCGFLARGVSTSAWAIGSGASYATPLVAGEAALIRGVRRDASPAQVQAIIQSTADNVSSANGGSNVKRVNGFNAVKSAAGL